MFVHECHYHSVLWFGDVRVVICHAHSFLYPQHLAQCLIQKVSQWMLHRLNLWRENDQERQADVLESCLISQDSWATQPRCSLPSLLLFSHTNTSQVPHWETDIPVRGGSWLTKSSRVKCYWLCSFGPSIYEMSFSMNILQLKVYCSVCFMLWIFQLHVFHILVLSTRSFPDYAPCLGCTKKQLT